MLLLRSFPFSSLIADQLTVYAQTAPFLVQYCNYEAAQWRGSRCLARCEGGLLRFGAPWAPASLSSHSCYTAQKGLQRVFCQPPLSSSPALQLSSYAKMFMCKEIRVGGLEESQWQLLPSTCRLSSALSFNPSGGSSRWVQVTLVLGQVTSDTCTHVDALISRARGLGNGTLSPTYFPPFKHSSHCIV